VIEPGEFVVIFGGSGSGKSTLLDALNGRRPASSGRVLYNGVDLYNAFDMFRASIGYVPQQDIVHRRLKVRRALEYTARLRLPPDTSEQEIATYVEEVLQNVRLQDKADLIIDTPAPLSGGQLKRVSLASELVAKPGILFLDEVTSGLDAGTDRQMMQTFAELADGGKTVACVTHSLENIADTADLVVLLHRGRLAYFGPPGGVCGHFRIKRLSDIYELLETRPPEQWAAEFKASPRYQQYITGRLSSAAQMPAVAATPRPRLAGAGKTQGHGGGFFTQTKILTRRYIDLILGDKRNLAILLLQAPLIGAVIGTVFSAEGELPARAVAQSQVSFMLVLSAIWFGCLNSAREFVKELPVYLRERSVNLGLAPYMLSKLAPLAAICLVQCALLLAVVSGLLDLPGSFGARLLLLSCAAFGATAMGLAISAFVDSNDKAIAMVPILLIPQVVLSNAIVRLDGATLWAAKLSMISFWGYDAMKSTLSGDILGLKDALGRAVVPVLETYGRGLIAIALMTLVFLILAWVGLRLKDRRG
jgi:ABC-type multidrug transport system ATPase subunit